jgi:hypothetical protein
MTARFILLGLLIASGAWLVITPASNAGLNMWGLCGFVGVC